MCGHVTFPENKKGISAQCNFKLIHVLKLIVHIFLAVKINIRGVKDGTLELYMTELPERNSNIAEVCIVQIVIEFLSNL